MCYSLLRASQAEKKQKKKDAADYNYWIGRVPSCRGGLFGLQLFGQSSDQNHFKKLNSGTQIFSFLITQASYRA